MKQIEIVIDLETKETVVFVNGKEYMRGDSDNIYNNLLIEK